MGIKSRAARAIATILFLWALFITPAQANLPATVALPALPTTDAALVTLDGRPVAMSPTGAWVLSEDRSQWTPLHFGFRIPARSSVVSAGQGAVLINRTRPAIRHLITVERHGDRLIARRTVPLPQALGAAQAAWDGVALLVGGVTADGSPRLFRRGFAGSWIVEPAWPSGSTPALLAAQNKARFVIGTDGHQWRWSAASGWRTGARVPGTVVGEATPIGQAHLLYAVEHGGRAMLYTYSTITDAWAAIGRLPTDRVTSAAAAGDRLLVAATDGGDRRVWRIGITSPPPGLATVDLAIIAVYMLAMLGMGLYFYSQANKDSSTEFFLGNRRIPFWAAGLSMFAGTIGSVNYLAYPAKSFETDWQYLMSKATYVGALVVVAIFLAPFFRRLNLVSVYSYLEARFHLGIRLLASGLWIVLQLTARMGIILYLPALAINTMTGIDIVTCIVVVGLFTIVYTALGGMRAVVWTDVVQVFVLMGGALFAIGYIFWDLGMATVIDTTMQFDKTRAVNLSFDVKQPTIWTFLVLAVLEGILCFPRDQIVMQRVLSTSSPKEATWSILTFAAVLLPSAVIFYGIGTALFAFYRAHPAQLDPTLPIDAVFPAFIGTQLPHGVVGLVVAGVLAAAMGVLSGIINSVSTLVSVDFYERFGPARTQKQIVRFSELVCVVVGLIGIALAIVLSRMNVHSLLDLTIELGGVFGGSFAGAYPLGMFSTRTNWQGAAIGIVVSLAVTVTIWAMQAVHPYLYLAIAIFVTLVVGYLASLFFPPPTQQLTGLTVVNRFRRGARLPA